MRRHRFKKALVLAAIVLGILVGLSGAYIVKAETVDGRGIVIIDGDTIDVRGERIRILNIDAPESFRSRCEAELKLALRTEERLGQLLRSGPVEVGREGQDRYRRSLAMLSVREGDVGRILVRERLALPWKDGREDKERRLKVWCGPWARLPN
jgi:endonuclease YncB( thermonuclease family)